MKIFKTIKSSIYDKYFYKTISNESSKLSFKYFSKFNLVVSLIISFILLILAIPSVLYITKQSTIDKFTSVFPSDLVVTIKNSEISTNQIEPYTIPMTSLFVSQNNKIPKGPKNLITINTKDEFSFDRYNQSESLVYLSKNIFAVKDSGTSIKVQQITKGVPDMVIDRDLVSSKLNHYIPYLRYFLPFIFITFLVFLYIYLFISNVIFLLVASLIILLISKLMKIKTSYSQIFKIGLYLITAIILLKIFVLFVLGIMLPWWINLAVFIWLYHINIGLNKPNAN